MNKHEFFEKARAERVVKVDIPDLGEFYVKKMSVEEIALMDARMKEMNDKYNAPMAALAVLGACYDSGDPMFEMDDIPRITSEAHFRWIKDLAEAFLSINKLNEPITKHVEEAEKN